jgi:hypothetical protein
MYSYVPVRLQSFLRSHVTIRRKKKEKSTQQQPARDSIGNQSPLGSNTPGLESPGCPPHELPHMWHSAELLYWNSGEGNRPKFEREMKIVDDILTDLAERGVFIHKEKETTITLCACARPHGRNGAIGNKRKKQKVKNQEKRPKRPETARCGHPTQSVKSVKSVSQHKRVMFGLAKASGSSMGR